MPGTALPKTMELHVATPRVAENLLGTYRESSYIVSNASKAVVPENYCQALTGVLGETIEKIQTRLNWQKSDTTIKAL